MLGSTKSEDARMIKKGLQSWCLDLFKFFKFV